ncbi:MAG: DUF4214 domain-containing protein [Desulfoprunum sp.]|nr:DUF4214 domain-containing protein [Desulfoprunum sp.]
MQTFTQPEKISAARSLEELLSFHDEHFIRCAYLTLVGREPDLQGMEYYLDRLRKGFCNESIVVQLAKTKEAQQSGLKLNGLDCLLRKQKNLYKLLALLFPGWIGWQRTQQQLNRLENAFGRMDGRMVHLEMDMGQRIGRIEKILDALHANSCQSTHLPVESLKTPSSTFEEPQPDLLGLTPRARIIFRQLEDAYTQSVSEGWAV